MNLWCKRCETLTEHEVTRTFTGKTTRGKRGSRENRVDLTPRDGVIPLVVDATCECGGKGRFICNSNSVTVPS